MITIKSSLELELMRKANAIVGDVLELMRESVRPGVTTYELDKIAHDYIVKSGAKPSFLGYGGFPASICASVNEEVIHGIPSKSRVLQEGDIVSIDVGTLYKGYNGDAARTFAVGAVDELKLKLMRVTEESFFKGIEILKDGVRLGDLGYAIQCHAESNGFSIVRDYVGHGIGQNMHEDPQIPNYGRAGHGLRVKSGMTLAIEPMINAGNYGVEVLDDGWTVVTVDGLPSAHYENTVAVTDDGVEILSIKR